MLALPVNRPTPPPLRTHPVRSSSRSRASLDDRPEPPPTEHALREALARVSTPADAELAKQQQAFNQMLRVQAEQEREANAISDLIVAQAKKDDELMRAWIRMI
jgi:hypothetical protein